MKFIYNKIFLEHNTGAHPENRKRLEALGEIPETDIINGEEFLELVHSKNHIEHARQACLLSQPLDVDTRTSPGSYAAAIHAVGAAVMASQTQNFALVRPPGHHSYPDHASGFCLFNNIAIASQRLVNEGKRIAIIDFDGHYGDGTSHIFYNSDKVLYCSSHQYPAFPGNGFTDEIGEEIGKGFNVCVPLPPESGDDIFMQSLSQIIIPIVKQFKPDVVGISAGFDAYQHDPLLNLNVTVNSFYETGKLLKENFENVFAVLEGGYNIEALPKCIFNFLNGINGEKILYSEEQTKSSDHVIREFKTRFAQVRHNLSPYWKF